MEREQLSQVPQFNGQRRNERQVDKAELDAKAARLRQYGFSYRQIAKELGLPHPESAHRAVKRALHEIVREAGEDLLKIETERFDALIAPMMRLVEKGTPTEQLQAVDRVLRISAERRKLLGLDAPVKTEMRITDSLDAQLEQLAAEVAMIESETAREGEDA